MARKKAAPNTSGGKIAETELELKISVNPTDGLDVRYANFAEVSHTANDFTIAFTRLPSTLSPDRLQEARETGLIKLDAETAVVVPPTLLPGLVRVLKVQINRFESKFGPKRPGCQ